MLKPKDKTIIHSDMVIVSKFAVHKNRDPQEKPLEDYVLADDSRGIYIVCDGVTRSLINGTYPKDSPAIKASRLFADTVYQALTRYISSTSPNDALQESVIEGNNAIRQFNNGRFKYIDYLENDFAGTVAIIGIVVDDRFHFAYNGDCCGYSVINNAITKLTFPQTAKVAEYRNQVGVTRETTLRIRRDFRNNKKSTFGYGVFTGETRALEFVEYGCINLIVGQTIVLASDGVDYLLDNNPQMLYETSPEVIIAEAEKLENQLKIRSDDKAVIILRIS